MDYSLFLALIFSIIFFENFILYKLAHEKDSFDIRKSEKMKL